MFNKDEMDNKIHQLYQQYCKFANIDVPVDMAIDYWDKLDFSVSIGEPSILHASTKIVELLWNRAIPTLYHEFTHIQDDATYFLHLPLNRRAVEIKPFTKIHATDIEIKAALGCTNANEIIEVKPNSQFISINSKVDTFEKYLNEANKLFKNALNKYENNKTNTNLSYALTEVFYAIGRFRFVQKHIPELLYTSSELKHANNIFGDGVARINNFAMCDMFSDEIISQMCTEWLRIVKRFRK